VRILITGSRDWTNRYLIREAIKAVVAGSGRTIADNDVTIVHGAARGADRLAASVAFELAYRDEPHSADWKRYGKAAGHRRNADMVAAGVDVCLAFPIGESRGTRGCMRMAEAAGIPVVVHEGGAS
jgi:YspA, cpYpsA-related SLOG family